MPCLVAGRGSRIRVGGVTGRMVGADRPSAAELEELKEVLELAGVEDARIERLLRVAALSQARCNDFMRLYADAAAQEEARGVARDDFYPYDSVAGAFRLGTTPAGEPMGLTPDQLIEHVLIVGRTGAGKTTLFYNLLQECAGWDVPTLVFDFKTDYRHLVQHREDLLVVNWRDLKFNPLQPPPGVQSGKWGEVLADAFAHATDLLIGSESYFLEKLRELYEVYEEADGEDAEVYPSLFELRDLVDVDHVPKASPRYQYKERVWGRLAMLTGFSGQILDCSAGFPIQDLLDRDVVLELSEPNQYVTNFVVEAVLTWIFYYREAQAQRDEGLQHVVLFDEAKRVFDVNRERQPEAGFPPIDALVGEVREFGEALIVADHEPSKLTDSIKANTGAKLWLSLGSGKDTQEMAATFGLDPAETDFTRTLELGEGLFKLADRDPVPITLPDYELEKAMTEDEIRERMAPELEALAWTARVRPEEFLDATGLESDDDDEADTDEKRVGEVAEVLLASVVEEPFLSLSARYDEIDVVARQGNAAKQELLSLGLVREAEVRTGKPGRNPKLLELTRAGRGFLEERGHKVDEVGRRSIEHRYWQHQLTRYYEAEGFNVMIEYAVDQGRIDVYAEREDESVALEVARSPEHELANIEKCLAAGVDRVEVVYLDEAVRDRIEAAVQEAFDEVPARVRLVAASEYA